MPSEPEVKPRQRLAPMSSTCENAIVASTKYGPAQPVREEADDVPAAVASRGADEQPNHGEMFQRTPQSAAA